MNDSFRSFEDFWTYYLSEHARQETRVLHLAGTAGALACVVLAVYLARPELALLALVVGYGLAWFGHFHFEGNGPATFEHPLWSLRGDLRMLRLWLTGGLRDGLKRNGLPC